MIQNTQYGFGGGWEGPSGTPRTLLYKFCVACGVQHVISSVIPVACGVQLFHTMKTLTSQYRVRNIFLDNGKWRGAEIYLLVVLLVFGLATSFLLPISGGYDEETHLMRVWEMSDLTFIPNDKLGGKLPFPAVYWELSYRRQTIVRPVEAGFWGKYKGLAIDAMDYIYGDVETRSVYSPPLLLPQAIVMRLLGRHWHLPALTVYYLLRITGLLSYLLLAWLAVRTIPFGKWIMALLASTPVAILQASTISADAISNGIGLLFIGGSIAIAVKSELRWKEAGTLALLFFLLFWGKLNIIPLAILPFLMIRPSQFRVKYGYIVVLLIAVILFALEVAGWNLLAYSRLATPPEGTDPAGQVKFMLTQPLAFLPILARNIWLNSAGYFLDWIAIYGFNYWPVPVGTYYFFIAALLAALLISDRTVEKPMRWALLVTFVIAYLATVVSLYVTFNPVGQTFIEGVQGRYFITVMPLLFLALAGVPFQKWTRAPASLPMFLGAMSLVVFMAGMYLSYHVNCGSQYYKMGLCYQPNYKNWAPDALYSEPVSNQLTLQQEIVPECNGMSQLRIWVNANEADPQGKTEFILKDVGLNKEIASASVPNSELPAGDWYTLDFEPDWESNGRFYLFTILSNSNGAQIAYTLKQEYTAGKLYENEEPIGKDMIFQWGCMAGLEKMLTSLPR